MSASRVLPSHPNLEQLKNQAKDLLKACLDGDAHAIDRVRAVYEPKSEVLTLREAQQALAREYGFTTWQALADKVSGQEDRIAAFKRAIDENDVDRVRQWVNDDPSFLNAPIGYGGAGALTWAAECRGSATPPSEARLQTARILMEAGADPNEHTGSPLFRAVLNSGRIPMMALLVSRGARVNAIWKDYGPILMGACETLAPRSIAWMLEHGADPNLKTANGRYFSTALEMAINTYVHRNREVCIEALVQGGAHFEDGPEMDIHRGRVDLLAKRLNENPDRVTSFSTFRAGREYGGLYGGCPLRNPTLLHICAEFNAVEAATLLLERGADVNARARSDAAGVGNETPIFHAITSNFNRSFGVLELLLAHGADVSVRATVRVPTQGGAAPREDDVILKDVTPLGYVQAYPNTYQPGPGSGTKTELDTRPHDQVIALLKTHGAQV